jgi:hypothetical protein
VPRGFIGALGTIDEVCLVLVVAEPGDPFPGERHDRHGDSPHDVMAGVCEFAYRALERRCSQFHINLRYVLDLCWPDLELTAQLRKTWITESYLCSAAKEGGSVPARSWRCCARDYLIPQLELLHDRVIVALGSKAQNRTKGLPGVHGARAVAPPGSNKPGARESWNQIPSWLAEHKRSRRS